MRDNLQSFWTYGTLWFMEQGSAQNGDTPVTEADFALLAGEIARRFDDVIGELQSVYVKMREMHSDIARLQRGMESVLNVVTSIDEHLRELKTLPVRVERLEKARR
jgi:hypothetical protein